MMRIFPLVCHVFVHVQHNMAHALTKQRYREATEQVSTLSDQHARLLVLNGYLSSVGWFQTLLFSHQQTRKEPRLLTTLQTLER